MGRELKPTPEQQAIIDAFKREIDAPASMRKHLIVNAGAGAGKTSTLRMMSDARDDVRGLYLAFNKSVAESAKRAFGTNVECRTSHSLAYRYVMQSEYAPLMAKMKTGPQRDERQKIAQDFDLNKRFARVQERRNSGIQERAVGGFSLTSIALGVIERFCQTAAREPSAAHVVKPRNFIPANFEKYRETVWALVEDVVHALWADVLDPNGKYLRFTHGHYLKLFALSSPVLPYDFILLDEAQDTAPVTEGIVTSQAPHALLVMVGDPSQAIYGFTGANDSMTRFEESGMSYESLTLSSSWRFGPEIASAANALLENTPRTMRLTGAGPQDSEVLHHLSDAVGETPSVYVCRSNFDVIQAALESIAKGDKVDTSSVDFSDIVNFLEGAKELKSGKQTKKGGLGPYKRWAEFELDYEDGVPMTEGQRVGMTMLDKYGTEDECQRQIQIIQQGSSRNEADVEVITIHKAKGGEWGDVSVRYDTAFRKVRESEGSEQMWWTMSDPNLAYVAVTRAIDVLDAGDLWPVVEYGIVCEPSILLSKARGYVNSLPVETRKSLALAQDDASRLAIVGDRRALIERMLKEASVVVGKGVVEGFVRLMADIEQYRKVEPVESSSHNTPTPAQSGEVARSGAEVPAV